METLAILMLALPPVGQVQAFDALADHAAVHLVITTPAPAGGGQNVWYLRTDHAGADWTKPVCVSAGTPGVDRLAGGNQPRLAARGDELAIVWTQVGQGPMKSGPLTLMRSSDRGKTWRRAPDLDSGSDTGLRFPAVAADDSSFHFIWIHAQGRQRSLRYASVPLATDAWSPVHTIDPEMCACCWNRLIVTPTGRLVALYRDARPRDMSVAYSDDRGGQWTVVPSIDGFGWDFDGCPHVGGGLAAGADGKVFATTWTAQGQRGGGYSVSSNDAGQTWSPPRPLPTQDRARHTDVATLGADQPVRVWNEPGVEDSPVFLSVGDAASAHRLTEPGASAEHPRVVTQGSSALVFWLQRDDAGGSHLLGALVHQP